MAVLLANQSSYSLLSSCLTIDKLIEGAKERGYSAIALCDHGSMFGTMEFILKAKQANIQPIVGLWVDASIDQLKAQFIILSKNEEGYKECIYLSNRMLKDGVVDFDELLTHTHHCVVIALGEGGYLEDDMIHQSVEPLREKLARLQQFKDVYIGLSNQHAPFWHKNNQWLKQQVQKQSMRTVALPKVYYLKEEDEIYHRILRGIKENLTLDDKRLLPRLHHHMPSTRQLVELYDIDDLISTDEIAEKCELFELNRRTSLPLFPLDAKVTSKQFLAQLCKVGLKKRMNGKPIPNEYIERLNFELQVITSMDYEDYFLIVYDVIRYAKTQHIYVGPGRGSSAGSLVAYVLGITHVDPIEYGLLFERFLNPERISMPDIDIDFPDTRRQEVIDYVKEKYGEEHVGSIITFNTLAAKAVIKDVGRVMGVPLKDLELLTKAIGNAPKVTLASAFKESVRFKKMLEQSSILNNVYQHALALEGLPRHISTHAAGIVLSGKPLQEVLPIVYIDEGLVSTQYSMEYLEDIGLIKMDFLGLRNLTIIDEIVNQMQPPIDILKIPLDDKETYQLIAKGDTMGVFQLESDGMKSLIRKMQPKEFDDIVATIALFRPGPMENIPAFLAAKENPQSTSYLIPQLKPILQSTFGIMIYQEQVMQIAQQIAGFSLGRADVLRKAISKKKESELQALRNEFIQGCLNRHISNDVAVELFDYILKFANYGFNKSHSVAYALISYQMAYLKANVPLLFYASLLSSVIGSEGKMAQYLDECRMRNITILPPSVQKSQRIFTIDDSAIRFPLIAIKGIGIAAYQLIEQERARGTFRSFFDFVARMSTHRFTGKWFESLIWSGACDEFDLSRQSMIATLDDAIVYADLVRIEVNGQSRIDLSLVSVPQVIAIADNPRLISEKEREVFGFFLMDHPLISMKAQMKKKYPPIATAITQVNHEVTFLAMISRFKATRTKKGDMMAFVTVGDEGMNMDCILWPRQYQMFQNLLVKGNIVEISGNIEEKGNCIVRHMTMIGSS